MPTPSEGEEEEKKMHLSTTRTAPFIGCRCQRVPGKATIQSGSRERVDATHTCKLAPTRLVGSSRAAEWMREYCEEVVLVMQATLETVKIADAEGC
jgi:hypothetical protein